ncbi:MAG: hypothetical protein A2915_01340 [Candidatus Yanofskybacteria bacterium RIFCSPLOWO2_01_FULL_41_34]|uniref:Alanine--tRNA ligase n=1 Tax=Candidatus Yanofskybacteria bacterium RIFCSPHIGHO2_01_FULL_41_26 TaxID=1802661 RepID=A0A1F8EAV0_9BACT|nr:MAG: hypothetical protein A2649_01815 [Candidatus Yanofskybacteria bacterium RIFCSPHIGHO2_01_FULL_41_26]OGN21877.1 MAG: hypothetical protein A2915_01340 [Candidatus Yanofskybacteria bacterium RIFCSPLOWO2_01_FULL_41_34]
MTHTEIRDKFLKFFEERGHKIVPSFSLVPENDPSVLFTTAGMQPMIPYLLGEIHPEGKRIANSQKCFRAQDIEEVGDNRHTTFFEMLGNWSFGDYWKKEQLNWIFDFLVNEAKINPQNLYITVFAGNNQIPRDTESVQIWKELFKKVDIEAVDLENAEQEGMRNGRIFYYSDKKNWWSLSGTPEEMAVGQPGGPDSEMFYDFGNTEQHDFEKYGPACHVNCDCGRYLEIGNNVFMEYQKQANGSFKPLPQKNIDFGGGLERITAASQNQSDIFSTDFFETIMEAVKKHVTKPLDGERSLRIISDHLRASVFLISEKLRPSNKDRGYILRRLIRRATMHATLRGGDKYPFMEIFDSIIDTYKDTAYYSEINANREEIEKVLHEEAQRFSSRIREGEEHYLKFGKKISGEEAFLLEQSYGFPIELLKELAKRDGKEIDETRFRKEKEQHQEISRAGAEKKFGGHGLLMDTGELKAGNEEELKKATRLHTATHLLHASLRKVLGPDVHQAGSDITSERLRFDFTFPRKMTPEEIKRVEDMVNEAVQKDYSVTKEELSYEDAIKSGALAFFKLKYPPKVNVYSVGDFSKELCGGPHVSRTREIGKIKITKEEAISAGVRRIRATVE